MPLDVYPCSSMLKAIAWSQVYVDCRASRIYLFFLPVPISVAVSILHSPASLLLSMFPRLFVCGNILRSIFLLVPGKLELSSEGHVPLG